MLLVFRRFPLDELPRRLEEDTRKNLEAMQVPWVRGFLGVQSTNACATRVMSWLPQEGGAPSFAQRAFLEKAPKHGVEKLCGFLGRMEKKQRKPFSI